jgi:ribonuclease BN (tRNA processing enzyme)
MDHLAGLPYYLSQRYFQGMKPGTVLLPQELAPGVDRLLRCWRDVERQGTPYKLVPMARGRRTRCGAISSSAPSPRTTAARASDSRWSACAKS